MSIAEAGPASNPEQRFDEQRITGLVDRLIEDGRLTTDKPFGMVIMKGDEDVSDIARVPEYTKFLKEFGNDYVLMEREYGPYDHASTFVSIIDTINRRPAATLRLIHDSPAGLMTLNDVRDPEGEWGADMEALINAHNRAGKPPLDRSKVLDNATVARAEAYDENKDIKKLLSSALYVGVWQYAFQHGYTDMITIFDLTPLAEFQRRFDNAWGEIPSLGPARYLDSDESQPLYMDLVEVRDRLAQNKPELLAFVDNPVQIAPYINFPDQA